MGTADLNTHLGRNLRRLHDLLTLACISMAAIVDGLDAEVWVAGSTSGLEGV